MTGLGRLEFVGNRNTEFLRLQNRVAELEKLHKPGTTKENNHPHAFIGEGTYVHPSAVLMAGVTIGVDCYIGPNVVIGWHGFGYEKDANGEWQYRDHNFSVVIGDRVDIGAGTVIDKGRYRDTVIGNGTKIDANVFIAHNCIIGKRCLIVANSQISGSCEIGDDCHIGPAAMLTDHIKVPAGSRCGMGSVVIRDPEAGTTVVGNPAKDIELRRKGGKRYANDHPGSHGDIRTTEWDDAFGDGCELSLPVANGQTEFEQRRNMAHSESGYLTSIERMKLRDELLRRAERNLGK